MNVWQHYRLVDQINLMEDVLEMQVITSRYSHMYSLQMKFSINSSHSPNCSLSNLQYN